MNDCQLYMKAMRDNNVDLCLQLERKYGLDGFPPSIVSSVLRRVVIDGENLDNAIEEALAESFE